jgi:hypothetical protein
MTRVHSRKVLMGVVIFAVLVLSGIAYVIMPRGEPVIIQKSDMIFDLVREGDIICRFGDRFWSELFKDMSVADKRYSHIGIIHINNGRLTVINAEGNTGHGRDFVNEVAFDDFLKVARAVGIYRLKNIDGNQISNAAIEYLGVPFDWQFDMYDESKLYCTELLYVILKRVMPAVKLNTIYVRELGKEIIPPEAISNSEYFSEIYFTNGGR